MLQDLTNSWKALSASWLWKCFPCKKLSRCLRKWQLVGERSGGYGGWGKTLWPGSFCFQIVACATRRWALLWRRVGPSLLTDDGRRPCGFQCTSLIYWAYVSDVTVSLDSESCSGSDRQPTTKQWLCPFLVQVWLWEGLWSFFSVRLLSWSSLVVTYNPLFVTHHNPIKKWFIVVM